MTARASILLGINKMKVEVSKSTRAQKKYMVHVGTLTVHFGAKGYPDFTTHKDEERKKLYLARHAKREDWTLGGAQSAGFWSRWLLWNRPTIAESIRDINRRFNMRVTFRYFSLYAFLFRPPGTPQNEVQIASQTPHGPPVCLVSQVAKRAYLPKKCLLLSRDSLRRSRVQTSTLPTFSLDAFHF